jgi:hypothetical protein
VSKPADASTDNEFKELAARIKELIISLFIADTSNSVRTLRFNIRDPLVGRWPAILFDTRGNICERRGEMIQDIRGEIYLVQVDLLSRTVADKVIQVGENVWPRILT